MSKFKGFGIAVAKNEIFSSSFAAAVYLQSIAFAKKVYVLGEAGIALELDEVGIEHVDAFTLFGNTMLSREQLEVLSVDPDIGAVVVGVDSSFTYTKMAYAIKCLHGRAAECIFIATNMDPTLPVTGGVLPGGGSIVAAVQTAAQREPLIMGMTCDRHARVLRLRRSL